LGIGIGEVAADGTDDGLFVIRVPFISFSHDTAAMNVCPDRVQEVEEGEYD